MCLRFRQTVRRNTSCESQQDRPLFTGRKIPVLKNNLALLLSCLIGFALPFVKDARGVEPTSIREVHNGYRGLWDQDSGRDFHLTKVLSIGEIEGDGRYILGRVFDIAVDSEGAIYVLDNGYQHVKKYTKTGVFDAEIGRAGEGPGEFRFPLALTEKEGKLFVVDMSKVSVFDHDGLFLEEFRYGIQGGFPQSIRTANGDLFLACFDVFEQKVIHRYDSNRSKAQIFCDSYAAGQEIDVRIEQTFSGGALDVAGDGRIYYTQQHPYEIRIFSVEGDLLSRIYRHSDFMQPPVTEREGENITVGLPTSSSSIVLLGDGSFINVVKKTSEPKATMIDLFDGNGQLLASRRYDRSMNIRCRGPAGYLYGVEDDEYPRVVGYSVSYE